MLQESVNAAKWLSESDTAFLKRIFWVTRNITPIVDRNPEYQKLCAMMIDLYHQIVSKAMENEQAN